ncbi:MAG: branched-chain amino acid ABC transporter permease [Nitrososphaerota archaeon]|nr:branched-chain amino acid ABC transporter permease [Nitrososphaerota archaeon]
MVGTVIFCSLYSLMSIGLTLTYMTTRVPNFAHGSVITLGLYLAYTMFHFWGISPYLGSPLFFALGGTTAIAIYGLVLRPLAKRGVPLVGLMIATLAVDTVFLGVVNVYAGYLANVFHVGNSLTIIYFTADFSIWGIKGLFIMAPLFLLFITGGLYLLLTRTKFGIAMRASVENPNLAGVLGVNVGRVYIVSWFLAGGLAGIAGSFIPMEAAGSPSTGSDLIVAIFAASILGGLTNIYGAVAGGIIIGLSDSLLPTYLAQLLGSWVTAYSGSMPLLIMVAALLLTPNGVTSVNWRRLFRMEATVERVRV